MNKLFISTAFAATVLFNISAQAQPQNSQPMMEMITIEQAQTLADNTPVTIEGMIIQNLGNEKYSFKDTSGNTTVLEIDEEDWNGMTINPQDMVIITGKTDKGMGEFEIDVDTIALKK